MEQQQTSGTECNLFAGEFLTSSQIGINWRSQKITPPWKNIYLESDEDDTATASRHGPFYIMYGVSKGQRRFTDVELYRYVIAIFPDIEKTPLTWRETANWYLSSKEGVEWTREIADFVWRVSSQTKALLFEEGSEEQYFLGDFIDRVRDTYAFREDGEYMAAIDNALKRLEARKDEDIESWADALSSDLAKFAD